VRSRSHGCGGHSFTQPSYVPLSSLLPPSSLSYIGIELDSASIYCGDKKNSHSCAIFKKRWKSTHECRRLDACLKSYWHENMLTMLAKKVHANGMNFVFIPMTRSFGGRSIPRHELIGRVTRPPAWQSKGCVAISVPITHPSSWFRLGDAVPKGRSAVRAVVAAVVSAVSEAAPAAHQ
jgi:hypothetical protein